MAIVYLHPNLRRLYLAILVFCIIPGLGSAAVAALGNDTDRLALFDLKNRISEDPFKVMSTWNESVYHCQWKGVTCNPTNGRVTILNLTSLKLGGSIPPSMGNLTFLTGINLRNNSFRGEIPQEIGRLLHLQHLNFTYNSLAGAIPTNLTHCTELRVLDLVYNGLAGQIPDELTSLSKLLLLGLGGNRLTGSIPTWVGNFSSLRILTLALNGLQGSIPPELGRLQNLRVFQVYGNELSGQIPLPIYNISSIYYFSVTQNQLHGQLPQNVGLTLPNLEIFAGGVNQFTGQIPASLPNASRLSLVDFAENALSGTVPTVLGKLQGLYRINFDQNKLGSRKSGDLSFLSFLANCTGLEVLGLAQNHFGGELPNSIGNLSANLTILTLGANLLYGEIPVGIGNLVSLSLLGLEENDFNGSIPSVIGKLQNLGELHLNDNRFSGQIPPSIGNLTSLTRLHMEINRLEGTIPSELGSCRSLIELNLTGNKLSGPIPNEIMGLSSLSISLAVAHNSLTGSLPLEVGKLVNLMELDVSENNLSGEIPSILSSCTSLERLVLAGNLLQGTMPETLKALRGLVYIDFSRNNLSGEIPEVLGGLSSLKTINLSFNNLVGDVPTEGIFGNASVIYIEGNSKLCGGVPELKLPTCPKDATHRKPSLVLIVVVPVLISVIFLVFLSCAFAVFFSLKNSRRACTAGSSSKDWELGISYQEVYDFTNGFSQDNLIGSGSFGTVYKGRLSDDGPILAVKILNLQQEGALKSFIAELNSLGSIKHRNLLKVISACSDVDPCGNDFKCLVLEFMSNGNLDQWLHPSNGDQSWVKRLNIMDRLNISIDVASALHYLHDNCHVPIVHCDLKPSNVLLDEDMTAHVGDFGLARFLLEASSEPQNKTMSVGLKGSIGYIPPEYGSGGQVSTFGDVYSYGILLLELFTGKRPTDDIFKDGIHILQYVATALPGRVMEIIDPLMLIEGEDSKDENEFEELEERAIFYDDISGEDYSNMLEECLVSVLKIGLLCSKSLPRDRMPMDIVVNKLHDIRDTFSRSRDRKRSTKSV